MTRYKIGIVGFGSFSKLLVKYLSPYADIVVSSHHEPGEHEKAGIRFGLIEEVLSQPIIIPSIPSQFFNDFFSEHAGKINPTALIIDVCSVKVSPLQVLSILAPNTCQIIGTHPLFGPASVRENGGIEGLKCVVSSVRSSDETQAEFIHFLETTLKLSVLLKTPEEHDREMAYVQGLSHYIGRIMDIMQIPDTQLATLAYEDLVGMKNVQGSDSWELFESIMKENPYAHEVNRRFKIASKDLDERLGI